MLAVYIILGILLFNVSTYFFTMFVLDRIKASPVWTIKKRWFESLSEKQKAEYDKSNTKDDEWKAINDEVYRVVGKYLSYWNSDYDIMSDCSLRDFSFSRNHEVIFIPVIGPIVLLVELFKDYKSVRKAECLYMYAHHWFWWPKDSNDKTARQIKLENKLLDKIEKTRFVNKAKKDILG